MASPGNVPQCPKLGSGWRGSQSHDFYRTLVKETKSATMNIFRKILFSF